MMKRNILSYLTAACLAALTALTSCGEDRSGEYYALISSKTWMYQTMQDYYLFYQDLPAESELDFFMYARTVSECCRIRERQEKRSTLFAYRLGKDYFHHPNLERSPHLRLRSGHAPG